jgi:hypothetical protein
MGVPVLSAEPALLAMATCCSENHHEIHFISIINNCQLAIVTSIYHHFPLTKPPLSKTMAVPAKESCPMNTPSKKTLTLVLSDIEMDVLDTLSSERSLSKTAVLRQALRLYQTVDIRQQRGDKLFFENEMSKEKAELMLL